jgi:hypothetical protein
MKKPHLLFILSALLLVNAASCIAEIGKSKSHMFLVLTNGDAWVTWEPSRSENPQASGAFRIGAALPNSITHTNLDGLWFIMATPTNMYRAGQPIPCWTYICSDTTNYMLVRRAGSEGFAPGFGSMEVINERGESLKLKPKVISPDRRLPSQRLPLVRKGQSGLQATFQLNDYFDLSQPGTYRISFKGRLPSGANPQKEIEFETAPLVLHLVPDSKEPSDGKSVPR